MKQVYVTYALIMNTEKKILVAKNQRGEDFNYSLPGGASKKGKLYKKL